MMVKSFFSFSRVSLFVFFLPSLSLACHQKDCPHSTTDTGVHWSRTLHFSYKGTVFNLDGEHQEMSKKAAKKEEQEKIKYLNLALGNFQFVYKEGSSFKVSRPFEIKALDANNYLTPFFSNLDEEHKTNASFLSFPKETPNEAQYKSAEQLLSSLQTAPLALYIEKKERLYDEKNEIIEEIDKFLNPRKEELQIDEKRKRGKKRKRGEEELHNLYNNFKEKLRKNKNHSAKKLIEEIKTKQHVDNDFQNKITSYFNN